MSNLLEKLKSEDPALRRECVDELFTQELEEETVKVLCQALEDEDKGVRDSVAMTLSYNGCKYIPKYVVPYVSSMDISVRNLAGDILLKIGDDAMAELTNYIDIGNDDDKKFVIDLLGLIGNPEPYSKITEVLESNENENVILACLEALGNLKVEKAFKHIIAFYDKNELYKPTIIEALGKIGSAEALDYIIGKYESEEELTKFSIIESLGQLGNEQTFYFLISELNKVEGPLQWPIVSSLYALKSKFGMEIPFDESVKNAILYTLLESEMTYKKAASNLISLFDEREILDACLKIYGEDFEIDENIKPLLFENAGNVYQKLMEIIKAKPRNLKSLLYLMKEMTDMDAEMILSGLSEIEKRNLCDSFSVSLDNPDEEVRKTAMELLFIVSPDTAIIFVDSMLADDNIWNRLKLVELLENYYEPAATDVLKKMAFDTEEMIAERARWCLSQRGITDF